MTSCPVSVDTGCLQAPTSARVVGAATGPCVRIANTGFVTALDSSPRWGFKQHRKATQHKIELCDATHSGRSEALPVYAIQHLQ